MKKGILLLLFSIRVVSIFAQYESLGSWNIINLRGVLSDKWSFFAEGQVRSLKYYDDFHYHEFKGGLTFEVNNYFRFSLATGKYDTYK
jgi:hypothetical protein